MNNPTYQKVTKLGGYNGRSGSQSDYHWFTLKRKAKKDLEPELKMTTDISFTKLNGYTIVLKKHLKWSIHWKTLFLYYFSNIYYYYSIYINRWHDQRKSIWRRESSISSILLDVIGKLILLMDPVRSTKLWYLLEWKKQW